MSSLHVVCIRSVNMNVGAFFILLIQSGSDETSRAYGRAKNLSVVSIPFLVSLSGFKPFLCFCPFFFNSFHFFSVVATPFFICVSSFNHFLDFCQWFKSFLVDFIGLNRVLNFFHWFQLFCLFLSAVLTVFLDVHQ